MLATFGREWKAVRVCVVSLLMDHSDYSMPFTWMKEVWYLATSTVRAEKKRKNASDFTLPCFNDWR